MLVPGLTEKYAMNMADVYESASDRAPEWGDYLAASAEDAFERTTTDVAMTESRVRSAEEKAYGAYSQSYSLTGIELGEEQWGVGFLEGETPQAIIEKDAWNEANPYFRQGVAWQPNMTEERARIYAEDYDERQARKILLEQGSKSFGFWKGSVPGFFAGIAGSLPDPVNLAPIGRAFNTGKGLAAGIKSGVIEGALGNAAVDAFVLPDLKNRGEDVGFADFALDVAFGAFIGGALGGLGGWAGARRESRLAGIEREAPPVIADVMLDGRNPAADMARNLATGEERAAITKSMGAAIDDVNNGRPVDVGPILDPLSPINKTQPPGVMGALRQEETPGAGPERPRTGEDTTKSKSLSERTREGLDILKNGDLDGGADLPGALRMSSGPESIAHAFVREDPEVYPEVQPVSREADATPSAYDVDPETGLLQEERIAMEEIAQGRVAPETADDFARARDVEATRQNMEEAGYSILDCILGASA